MHPNAPKAHRHHHACNGKRCDWRWFHRQPRNRFERPQNVLAVETKRILDTGERFVLLSLDPTRPVFRGEPATWALPVNREPPPPPPPDPTKEYFHEYVVLGKTEIRDQKQRAELLRALYKGIADWDGRAAACFIPRHGISATLAGETVDLVICFECSGMRYTRRMAKVWLPRVRQDAYLIAHCKKLACDWPTGADRQRAQSMTITHVAIIGVGISFTGLGLAGLSLLFGFSL
jgi:hypothetical protein